MNLSEVEEKFKEIKKRSEKQFVSPFELEPLDYALDVMISEVGYTDKILELEDEIQDLRMDLYER